MNYGQIFLVDCANGPGCRTSLFVSGCTHHCEGCFQPETWDFDYGKPYTREVEDYIVETLKPDYIEGLTLLGGEPMEKANQAAILPLIRRTRRLGRKTIWVYSGYLYEQLTDPSCTRCRCGVTDEILDSIDILVDGPFVQEKKNISLHFRGSENQRIIDMKKTREKGRIVLSPLDENYREE